MKTPVVSFRRWFQLGGACSTHPYAKSVNAKQNAKEVKDMFYHAYDSYMLYAFPKDELRPLTKTGANSLGELGNLKLEHLSKSYQGTALTLIDSLSTLAVLRNHSEFARNVKWLEDNLDFDLDVRVNVFECNIRVLGGLLSAHMLAGVRRLRAVRVSEHIRLTPPPVLKARWCFSTS